MDEISTVVWIVDVKQESETVTSYATGYRVQKDKIKIGNLKNELINFKRKQEVHSPLQYQTFNEPLRINLEFFLQTKSTLFHKFQADTDCHR